MQALTWEYYVAVTEKPVPPIKEKHVLGKVLAAMFGAIERAVMLGLYPVTPKTVMGGFGVIRVVEPGVSASAKPGEVYGVVPMCNSEILGVNADGLLAEYAAPPESCLNKLPKDYISPEAPLWIEFSYLEELKENVEGKETLLIGCGFSGYVTANYIKDVADLHVACVEKALMDDIVSLGIKASLIDRLGDTKFEVVIIEPLSSYIATRSINFLREGGTLIVPPTQPKTVITYSGYPQKFKVIMPRFSSVRSGYEAFKHVPKKVREKAFTITPRLDEVPILIRYYGRVIHASKDLKR